MRNFLVYLVLLERQILPVGGDHMRKGRKYAVYNMNEQLISLKKEIISTHSLDERERLDREIRTIELTLEKIKIH